MKRPPLGVDSVLITPTDAATTELTARLDTAGAHYASVRVLLGVEKNTNNVDPVITLSESDDTVVTNFATWNASMSRSVDATATAVATSHIDLEGRKRYIRLVVTPDTTTNGDIEIAALATLENPVRSGTASDYGDDVVVG